MKWSQSVVFLFAALLVSSSAVVAASEYEEDAQELAGELTEHADPDLQAAALVTIGYIGTSEQRELLDDFRSADGPEERLGAGAGLILAGVGDGTEFAAEQVAEASSPHDALLELAGYLTEDQLRSVTAAALQETDGDERTEILEFLSTRSDDLHDQLTDRLTDSDSSVRSEAMEVMLDVAGTATIDIAEDLGSHHDADIRRQALDLTEAVAAYPELRSDVSDVLRSRLDDSNEEIRHQAARQLVYYDKQDGFDFFIERLSDMDPDERLETLELLVDYDVQADIDDIRPLINDVEMAPDSDERIEEWQLLYELAATDADNELFNELREKFSSTDFEDRIAALRSMGRTGRSEVTELYTRGLNEGRSDVRLYSARGLGHLEDPDTLSEMRSALQTESDQEVTLELINAVGQIRDDSAANILRFMATDNDDEVRMAIVEALAEIGLPATTSSLTMLARDRDSEIAWNAFLTLLSIDADEAQSHMSSALRNPPENFAEYLDPHELTDDAAEALYRGLLTHTTSRVHSVGLNDVIAHRDQLYPLVRDLVTSDEVEEEVRTALVNLMMDEDDSDQALATLEQVVQDYSDEKAGRIAAWYVARQGSEDFKETFEYFVDDHDIDDDETVIFVISNYALSNIE